MRNFHYKILILFLFSIAAITCKKENKDYADIPDVFVNYALYPNSLDFIQINGYKIIENQGYRGIIVYRMESFVFLAYERTCPYDPGKGCAQVEVEPSGLILVDSCCMSRYSILDGSPISGPATIPLKQYRTEFDGDRLLIYN